MAEAKFKYDQLSAEQRQALVAQRILALETDYFNQQLSLAILEGQNADGANNGPVEQTKQALAGIEAALKNLKAVDVK